MMRKCGTLLVALAGVLACVAGCFISRQPDPPPKEEAAIAEVPFFMPEWSQNGAVPASEKPLVPQETRPAVIFPAGASAPDVRDTRPPAIGEDPKTLRTIPEDNARGPVNPVTPTGDPPPPYAVTTGDFIRSLSRKLDQTPGDRQLRKKLACYCYFEGELSRAVELLEGTESWDDDEMNLIRSLISYRIGENNAAMNALESVRRKWRGVFQLALKNPLFCREVKGRSDVVRFEKYEFYPGQKGILLYFEVENFMCKADETGQHEVSIRATPQLLFMQPNPFDPSSTTSRVVQWPELPSVERLSFKKTYKHFIDELQMYIVLDLPKDLQPGTYAINLMVDDELARKQSAPVVLDFKVR
ncbi:MAG: hypothetical protein RDV41_14010 [Planctomycetota bacterium]|nr:hypothetical protein [Planctomycetota bacterium]